MNDDVRAIGAYLLFIGGIIGITMALVTFAGD